MNRGAVAGVAADVRSGSKADIGEGAIPLYPRKRTLVDRVGSGAAKKVADQFLRILLG
jgi:hypothetical protein